MVKQTVTQKSSPLMDASFFEGKNPPTVPASEKSMRGSSSSICSHCTSVSPCPKSMTDFTRNSMLGGSKNSFSPGCSENGWRLTAWTLGRSCRSHLVRSPSFPRKDCHDSTWVVLLKLAHRKHAPFFACFPYTSLRWSKHTYALDGAESQ